jgi:ribosomal protein L7/L12
MIATVLVCIGVALIVMTFVSFRSTIELVQTFTPSEQQTLSWVQLWTQPAAFGIAGIAILLVALYLWRIAARSAEVDPIAAQVASQSPTRISTSPLPAYEIDARAMERIKQSIAQNRKIEAIKLYREATGAGLKDARDAVLRIEAEMQMSGYF